MKNAAKLSLTALLAALAMVVASLITGHADAVHVPVDVAIDVDVAGNAANSLGPTESCNTTPLQVGDTLDVDVVVRGVPEFVLHTTPPTYRDGIVAFGANLLFDPSVVKVNQVHGFAGPTVLKAGGEFNVFQILDYNWTSGENDDGPPGTTGAIRFDMADISENYESGDGIATRITIEAVGEGRTRLHLADFLNDEPVMDGATVVDASSEAYTATTAGATIVVGSADCSLPAPTPFPTPVSSTTAPAITPAILPGTGDQRMRSEFPWTLPIALGATLALAGGYIVARRRS